MFAPRNRLVEFVLGENDYREEMLRTLTPLEWVCPAWATLHHPDEQVQGGMVKQLGVTKPWASSRSFGLVYRVDADEEIVESLHSRADGTRHGVTSVHARGDDLIVVAAGSGEVLLASGAGG